MGFDWAMVNKNHAMGKQQKPDFCKRGVRVVAAL